MKNIIGKYFFADAGLLTSNNKLIYLAGKVLKQIGNCSNDYTIKIIKSNVHGYEDGTERNIFLTNNHDIKVKYFNHMHELLACLI